MKIAQIVCSFPPYQGGIGNSADRLAKLLSPQFSVTSFTPRYQTKTKDTPQTKYLKPLFKLGQAAILPGLIFKLKSFDTIIFHYPFFGSAEILCLYRLFNRKQKLIVFYHMDVRQSNWLYKILAWSGHSAGQHLLKTADKIVVSSLDYIKHSQAKDLLTKRADKFVAIPFAIDTDKYQGKTKVNKIKKLLFVGGLDKAHYFKGVDKLISACSKLKNSNWQLEIVGIGDLQTLYQKQAQKLNLSQKINFLGRLDDNKLKYIYSQADILILPSINSNEAFGLVILEALASQTAIIASDLPGVRSVFNNECGLSVKPGDSQDLANKIDQLLKYPQLLQAMQIAARNLALNKYSWQRARDRWQTLLYENSSN